MVSKKKNRKNVIIISIAILIIVIVILAIIIIKKVSKPNIIIDESQNIQEIEAKKNEDIIKKLQGMSERDRMEYYFGVFIKYIEDENYKKAYDMLYDEFKENYFPTLESFETYIPTLFFKMNSITHDNIERNGNIYVLWVYVSDAINGKPSEYKEINVVIQENDYNDFEMSFSVI